MYRRFITGIRVIVRRFATGGLVMYRRFTTGGMVICHVRTSDVLSFYKGCDGDRSSFCHIYIYIYIYIPYSCLDFLMLQLNDGIFVN